MMVLQYCKHGNLRHHYLNQTKTYDFKIYDLFFDYIKKHPFNYYEKKLNLPSLILAGDKDVIPLHYMEKLHATLPASIYKVIENCGHFSYIDQPEVLFDSVKLFINSNS